MNKKSVSNCLDTVKKLQDLVDDKEKSNLVIFMSTVRSLDTLNQIKTTADNLAQQVGVMRCDVMIGNWVVWTWLQGHVALAIRKAITHIDRVVVPYDWLSALVHKVIKFYDTTQKKLVVKPNEVFGLYDKPLDKKMELKPVTIFRKKIHVVGEERTTMITSNALGLIASWMGLVYDNDSADAWYYRGAFIDSIFRVS